MREVKNAIYNRRANLKNLDRLADLLVLYQLEQMGHANERDIMAALRRRHIDSHGQPPARRTHDDPARDALTDRGCHGRPCGRYAAAPTSRVVSPSTTMACPSRSGR